MFTTRLYVLAKLLFCDVKLGFPLHEIALPYVKLHSPLKTLLWKKFITVEAGRGQLFLAIRLMSLLFYYYNPSVNAINMLNACSLVWPVCEGHMNSEHAIANTKRSWFVEAFSSYSMSLLFIPLLSVPSII